MGKTFEGCSQAREISLTRKAANTHAVVLVRKTAAAGATSETQPEITDMDAAEIQKAALTQAAAIVAKTAVWTDVTRSYFAALPAESHEAFLAKSAAEQTAEADAAKAAADRKAVEDETAKSGKTARELELEKRIAGQDEIIKGLAQRQADAEIEKRASSEFAGFPGGQAAAVETLKTAKALRDAGNETGAVSIETLMKSQVDMARAGGHRYGARADVDTSKSAGARERIDAEATKRAKEKNIPIGDARMSVYEDAAFAADVDIIERGE